MYILFKDDVALKLLTIAHAVGPLEFSGNAFSFKDDDAIVVYDFVLLHVGSYGYTEIKPERMLPLIQRPDAANLRGWIHKHPLGDGVPGSHNWSGTDERNIREAPCGSPPELIGWSWSAVLTPHGWVGRVDNHLTQATRHVRVLPDLSGVYAEAARLIPQQVYLPAEEYDLDDFDLTEEDLDNLGLTRQEYNRLLADTCEEDPCLDSTMVYKKRGRQ